MPPFPLARSEGPAVLNRLLPRLSALAAFISRRAFSTSPGAISTSQLVQDGTTIAKRQSIGLIPTAYQINGASPGTVAGAVLGSVAGFILIAMLIYNVAGGGSGGGGGGGQSITGEEEIVVRRRDRSRDRSHRSRHSRSDREVREVREISRSPRRPSRTIVEERTERFRERTPPPPRRGSFIVEERVSTSRPPPSVRRVDGDDIVEVIEEHSVSTPPRRHKSKRSSNGYRQVAPFSYAEGDHPQRRVSERGSTRDS